MRRAVLVMLDGLRRDFINAADTPHLVAFAERGERFADFRTVFPSATRVVSSSLATGCAPARHQLQGNSLALIENGALVVHDAGHPDFLQHKRRVTGSSLAVPTLAERVKHHGGAIIFNNVSPGAAYAHDPDGHGHVYHRAGSFGPGRVPVPADHELRITLDVAGDRAMTERFVGEVVLGRRPALAVLWLGEPDHIQHNAPLGSPEHLAVLREADRNAGLVIAAVDRARDDGDEILLLVGSDHGHQSVGGAIDINAELVAHGLKADPSSGDVVSVSNGTAALIYVHPDHSSRSAALQDFLASRDWLDRVVPAAELATIGQAALHGLAFAVSMRSDDAPNAYGIPGTSLVAKPSDGKADRIGCGQHGGLARYEQSPFLIADGDGFGRGVARETAASVIDIAPTVLRHLGLSADEVDGAALQLVPAEQA
jgi:predicted AlkP superfamily pyrophosphatase or phosphodiesterase